MVDEPCARLDTCHGPLFIFDIEAVLAIVSSLPCNSTLAPMLTASSCCEGYTAEQWCAYAKKKAKIASTTCRELGRLRSLRACAATSAGDISQSDPLAGCDPWLNATPPPPVHWSTCSNDHWSDWAKRGPVDGNIVKSEVSLGGPEKDARCASGARTMEEKAAEQDQPKEEAKPAEEPAAAEAPKEETPSPEAPASEEAKPATETPAAVKTFAAIIIQSFFRGCMVRKQAQDVADFKFLEQQLDVCLAAMQESLKNMVVPDGKREEILDDLAESGMAAIQLSMQSSKGNLMLYRSFNRLRIALRRRIASMMPVQRGTSSSGLKVIRNGFSCKGTWRKSLGFAVLSVHPCFVGVAPRPCPGEA